MKPLTAISFAFIATLTTTGVTAQQVRPPLALEDGWTTASPRSKGLDEAPLVRLTTDVRSGSFRRITSVLVAYDGVLVYEEYFDDAGRPALRGTRSGSVPLPVEIRMA